MSKKLVKIETTLKDWEHDENYFNSFVIPDDPILEAVIKNNDKHNLPDISVSPAQGKLVHLLLRSIGAKRVLELGTLGGYSAIWLARALPDDGEVITLELNEHYAKIAAENIEAAGLTNKVKIMVGRAGDTLEKLKPSSPFDFVFIDADKVLFLEYFKHAKRLTRPGGVIIVDNVVRYGRASNPDPISAEAEGTRRLLHAIKADPDVDSTVVQIVGTKGYDGFLYAFKK